MEFPKVPPSKEFPKTFRGQKLSYSLNNAYGFWFDEVLKTYIEKHKSPEQSNEEYAVQNGFFITLNFDRNAVASRQRSLSETDKTVSSIEFWNTNHLYNVICNDLIGRRFLEAKNQDRLPKMIACADVNGTRYWQTMGETENVHLHTIWMVPSDMTEKFKTSIDQIDLSKFDFREINIQPLWGFDSDKQRASKLASYTSKFLCFNNEKLQIEEDIMIFPRVKSLSV